MRKRAKCIHPRILWQVFDSTTSYCTCSIMYVFSTSLKWSTREDMVTLVRVVRVGRG